MTTRNAKGQFVKTATKTKLLNALQRGETFTAKSAAKRFGVTSTEVSRRVYDLRSEGYCVYANRVAGSTEVMYRIGTPSKALIAAGFSAMRASGTSV